MEQAKLGVVGSVTLAARGCKRPPLLVQRLTASGCSRFCGEPINEPDGGMEKRIIGFLTAARGNRLVERLR